MSLESNNSPFAVVDSEGIAAARAQFSPDSRWVAYDSDERGDRRRGSLAIVGAMLFGCCRHTPSVSFKA